MRVVDTEINSLTVGRIAMSIFEQIANTMQYQLHTATYNPEAEKFAKEKAQASQSEIDSKNKAEEDKKKKEELDAQQKLKEQQEEAKRQAEKENSTFSIFRLIGTIAGTFFGILFIFCLFFLAILGASLATNLNLYHSAPYRIFYAIYGFLFFFLVIPYVLGYRWFWKGKRPKFYSLIPMIPYHLDNRWAALLFSWLSYRPDDQIECLKEWIKERDGH